MHAPSIHIKDAGLKFGNEWVFENLTLTIPAAQWTSLLGASGVGKSSLLRLIAGLTTPQETVKGEIYTNNHLAVHQQVAYMAQTDLLLPWLSVLGNATLGCSLRGESPQRDKATHLLEKVGLGKALHWFPSQLSGGMRQRAALVRTLMENKPIVLMDEPFSALDAITRYKLQELAAQLLKDKTVLFITHDPSEALRLANEVYILQGQPATAKLVARLETPSPRSLADTQVIELQSLLYQELVQAAGECV